MIMLEEDRKDTEKKIGIIGIGNLICGDEGFGIHVINYLEENYSIPDEVIVQDGGTAGIYLSPLVEQCDPVIIVDVVDIDAPPGSLHYYNSDDIKHGNIHTRMSPHQLGFLEILEICKLRETAPEEVEFYCVVPQKLDTSIELSETVAPRVKEIADKIRMRLAEKGVPLKPKPEKAGE